MSNLKKENLGPLITIVTPYYNAEEYIEKTAKSVLGQTFPLFEWLIIDDCSRNESVKKLKEIEKLDKRIKIIYSKISKKEPNPKGEITKKEPIPKGENPQGPAVTRDIGIRYSAESSKYIVFLDADDIFDKTFLECAYWTLETHPKASWTYTDTVNFGSKNFLWRKWYNVEWEKKENILTVSACVRKKDLLEVGGFELKEKKVYEDWYLWLKLIKAGKYPIRMNSLLTYYRQKEKNSELKSSNFDNKERAMGIINKISRQIYEYKDGIQFPKYDYNWEKIKDSNKNIVKLKRKENNKIHVLMIIPWMVTGGADKFNLDLISRLDKRKYEFTIITTVPSNNEWRKKFEKYAVIYDLTTFLDMKDWISFINYIIYKDNINLIFNSNSQLGYKILPYLKARHSNIPIVDYVHMEEWYWRNGGYSRDSVAIANVLDKTFTCNENSREIFVKKFGRKAKEVKTIYVGVDEKKFSRKQPTPIAKISRKQPTPIAKILYICRIVEQKRPFLFFEVCKKLWETRKDFEVIVAGDGPLLYAFEEKVKQNQMGQVFKFVR